jgi:hypothetical protein
MKAIHSMIAALALAFVLAAPADAATTDPEIILYRFPGVRDNGAAGNLGVATVFHCTNFSGVDETVRFVTRFSSGGLASNVAVTIQHLRTRSASTHPTAAYDAETDLATGAVGPGAGDPGQGTTAIAATSINVICTAMTIDASPAIPTRRCIARDQVQPGSGQSGVGDVTSGPRSRRAVLPSRRELLLFGSAGAQCCVELRSYEATAAH